MKTHWTKEQTNRLAHLLDKGVWTGYWNSDAQGFPCNNGGSKKSVYPGMVQRIKGPLEICEKGLHATTSPHIWKGTRVWIVALHGKIQKISDKACSLKREILGEVYPEESFLNGQVAVRLGCKELSYANLSGANLYGANLSNANLSNADLSYAGLRSADLSNANLSNANLIDADLSYANLKNADLKNADLSGAYLSGAILGNYKKSDLNKRGALI